MKTFNEQNNELINFDKSFDSYNSKSCVTRAMLLIKNRQAQMIENGYEWPIDTESCKWSVEQAIINRSENKSMMQAAIEYVESIEYRAEEFNRLV